MNALLCFNEQLNVLQSFTFLMSWCCGGVPAEKEVLKSVEVDALSVGQPALLWAALLFVAPVCCRASHFELISPKFMCFMCDV